MPNSRTFSLSATIAVSNGMKVVSGLFGQLRLSKTVIAAPNPPPVTTPAPPAITPAPPTPAPPTAPTLGPYVVSLPTPGPDTTATPSTTDANGATTLNALLNGSGTVINVPTGIYTISSPVVIPSGKTLKAAPGVAVTLKAANGYTGNMVTMSFCTGSTLKNVTVDGNQPNRSSSEGVSTTNSVMITGGSGNTVQNVKFLQTPSYAVWAFNSPGLQVLYNNFQDCWEPVKVDGNDLAGSGTISGNTFTNTTAFKSIQAIDAIYTKGLQIINNTFRGVGLLPPTSHGFEGTWGNSIYIFNSSGYLIENNTVYASYWSGVVVGQASTNALVQYNYFEHGTGQTYITQSSWIEQVGTDTITFTKNILKGGISMGDSGGDHLTITYNDITSPSGANAMDCNSGFLHGTISNNTVTEETLNHTGKGIYLWDKSTAGIAISVTNNTFQGFGEGIAVNNPGGTGTIYGLTITGNYLTNNAVDISIPGSLTRDSSCNIQSVSAPAPAPAPTPAPAALVATSYGVNIHTGGSNTAQNASIASILSLRNFTHQRMDLISTQSPWTTQRDLISRIISNSGQVQVSLQISYQTDNTIYSAGALSAIELDAYSQTYAVVNAMKDLVHDYELLNEIQSRPECVAQVTIQTGQLESAYTNQTAFNSIAAVCRGMADAIHAVSTSAGGTLRVILGCVSRDFGFLNFMNTQGVDYDVIGWHIYPRGNDVSLRTDTFYGTGGPLTKLAAFGKVVTINEFNSNEIFDAPYENSAGGAYTEAGYSGMAKHLLDLYSQSLVAVESIVFYELLDEPAKVAPGNHFGLMKDTNTPKVPLYIAAAFAGANQTPAERLEITSRGLVTAAQIYNMEKSHSAVAAPSNKVMGAYYPGWDQGTRIGSTPLHFTHLYLFNANPVGGSGGDGTMDFTYGYAMSAGEVQAVRARGQKVLFSFGGAGWGFIFDTRAKSTRFVSSFATVAAAWGGVDGCDFNNYEAGIHNSSNTAVFTGEMIWIAQQLRATYGANFLITTPASFNQVVDQNMVKAMKNAGVLDWVQPQFYEWDYVKSVGVISSWIQTWVNLLSDASKVCVGLMANASAFGETAISPILSECTREYNTIRAANPTIRGAYCWTLQSDMADFPADAWGSAMAALIFT